MTPDPNPRDLTDRALSCAIAACCRSQWFTDREFAKDCAAEQERRLMLARSGPTVGASNSRVGIGLLLHGTARRGREGHIR